MRQTFAALHSTRFRRPRRAWLAAPVPASAQAKDAFVEGLVDFSQASAGTFGNEGPAVKDALDKMSDGLARWDAAVARVETGFAGAITTAAPRQAAQMRATLGATYLERGRVADALPHLDAASLLETAPPQILRGLGQLRANQPAAAAEAFGRALAIDPGDVTAAMLFIDAARGAGPSKTRELAMAALLDGGVAYRRRRRRPTGAVAAAARSAGRRVGRGAVFPAECLRPRGGAAPRVEARRGAGQPAGGGECRPAGDRRGSRHGRGPGRLDRAPGSERQECRAGVAVGSGTGDLVGDPAAAGRRLLDARGLRAAAPIASGPPSD